MGEGWPTARTDLELVILKVLSPAPFPVRDSPVWFCGFWGPGPVRLDFEGVLRFPNGTARVGEPVHRGIHRVAVEHELHIVEVREGIILIQVCRGALDCLLRGSPATGDEVDDATLLEPLVVVYMTGNHYEFRFALQLLLVEQINDGHLVGSGIIVGTHLDVAYWLVMHRDEYESDVPGQ